MAIEPDFAAFARIYEAGRPQAIFARRIADLDTPVSAYLKLADGRDNSFLLESVQGGETRGRYSVIGLKPDLIWRCRDGKAEINSNALFADSLEMMLYGWQSYGVEGQGTNFTVWLPVRH